MYAIDERLRGLPASREQVVAVFQSINQPHLAIPGKQAGPAQAYIVGLRGSAGLSVFVYLYLAEHRDCAVYVPGRRNLSVSDYAALEQEAQSFVESMGFMMDNLNFRGQPAAQQEQLIRTLPVFLKDPRLAAAAVTARTAEAPSASPNQLGRLLSAF